MSAIWLEIGKLVEFSYSYNTGELRLVFELFAREIIYITLVSLGGSSVLALLSECGQMGFSVSTSGFLSRSINRFQVPTKAFLQKCSQSVYGFFYALLIIGACYQYFSYKKYEYLASIYLDQDRYYKYLWDFCYSSIISLFMGLLGIAVIDWLIARHKYKKSLMMSNDEIRSEHREEEGDPYIKAKRKLLHQGILNQDLVARVRKAKVVIVD